MPDLIKHYWNPSSGGALHAFPRPLEAVFTDDASAVTCDACLSSMPTGCGCYACIGHKPVGTSFLTVGMTRMIVCSKCGNKRCPHSTDHRNDCTGSNDTGQAGSRYGGLVTRPAVEGGDER